jgi:hypothetical protein
MSSHLFKTVSISVALLFIHACSHPIEIVGEGDVTSASGNRNCLLENFQAGDAVCSKNYVIDAYQETYYAMPRAGWKFDHWGNNYCPNASPPNYDCTFNVSADVVTQFWGQTMPPLKAVFTTCTSGTPGCGWQAGDVITMRQVDWDNAPILATSTPFSTVYPLGLRVGTLGIPGQFSILLSSGTTTLAYLPTVGANVALTQSYVDPVISAGGLFGGQLVALRLNVDFGAAGLIGGTFDLGDLYLCGLTTPAAVNGSTVSGFVTTANTLLARGSVPGVSIDDASQLAALINSSFLGGVPSSFAQTNLVNGPCP